MPTTTLAPAYTLTHAHDALPILVCRTCANEFIARHTGVSPIAVGVCTSGEGFEFGLWDVSPIEVESTTLCQFCDWEVAD